MHYTYVLLSEVDGRFSMGTTGDLRKRVKLHAIGRVRSTSYRRPLNLIYYEACSSLEDAYRRERFLKSGRGGRYLKTRLACSLSERRTNKLERY
jgi:putative endonuclease